MQLLLQHDNCRYPRRPLIVACCCREQWLAAAQKVFQSLDSKSNGLTMERLMRVLREKLPAAEVEYAVEDALVDAGYKGDSATLFTELWTLSYTHVRGCAFKVETMYCRCCIVEQCDPPYTGFA